VSHPVSEAIKKQSKKCELLAHFPVRFSAFSILKNSLKFSIFALRNPQPALRYLQFQCQNGVFQNLMPIFNTKNHKIFNIQLRKQLTFFTLL
jgi:hypothetical protein